MIKSNYICVCICVCICVYKLQQHLHITSNITSLTINKTSHKTGLVRILKWSVHFSFLNPIVRKCPKVCDMYVCSFGTGLCVGVDTMWQLTPIWYECWEARKNAGFVRERESEIGNHWSVTGDPTLVSLTHSLYISR